MKKVKLTLNKETVVDLNIENLNDIKGGRPSLLQPTISDPKCCISSPYCTDTNMTVARPLYCP
ncbi:MAG: hypothetical protein GY757_34605 [bacterium]|nr:hypothetical protein [bacterium]